MTTVLPVLRVLDDAECRALLARHRVGRIAYSHRDRVDIEPVTFAYDGDWLFCRTSIGSKLSTLAHNPWCAFEVDEVHAMFDWTSVVVKGSFHLLDPELGSPDTYRRAFTLLSSLVPGTFSSDDPVPHRTILFGIHAAEITGRTSSTDRE
ncbi:MAG: pyridoxamine 5'-phosphate oxidase family protein [Gemmatimonadaceae bacterium]|nr:pyridoxamine 5'-phosphate oxidase family protein [Gemmatimonadaceae bacterium]